MENMYDTLATYTPDNLIAGTHVRQLVKGITVKKGEGALMRGTVMGIIEAEGLCVPVDKNASDGSQEPYCILTDDIDIEKAEDIVTTGYYAGVFNERRLKFGDDNTIDDHRKAMRKVNLLVLETQE